jgi:hypothetical protein
MKSILTLQHPDGTFPTIGGTDRFVHTGINAYSVAKAFARERGRPVMIESWADSTFYKPDAKPVSTVVMP